MVLPESPAVQWEMVLFWRDGLTLPKLLSFWNRRPGLGEGLKSLFPAPVVHRCEHYPLAIEDPPYGDQGKLTAQTMAGLVECLELCAGLDRRKRPIGTGPPCRCQEHRLRAPGMGMEVGPGRAIVFPGFCWGLLSRTWCSRVKALQ